MRSPLPKGCPHVPQVQEGDEHRLVAPSLAVALSLAVATVPEPAPLLQSPAPRDQLVFLPPWCQQGQHSLQALS